MKRAVLYAASVATALFIGLMLVAARQAFLEYRTNQEAKGPSSPRPLTLRENVAVTEKLASLQRTAGDLPKTLDRANSVEPTYLPSRLDPSIIPVVAIGTESVAGLSPLQAGAVRLLRSGDVSGARLLLERASMSESGRALFLLAQTYDPIVLTELGLTEVRGDAAKAGELYERAQNLGIQQSAIRLAPTK